MPQYGSVHNNTSRRWTSGTVPYVIDSDVPNQSRITVAIDSIHAHNPGVRFVLRTSQANYVRVRRTTDPHICGQSVIGMGGGAQELLLNDNSGCGVGTMIHEFGHALGFWHEQSRCDRDSYVEILTQNIRPGFEGQFNRHCSDGVDVVSYDEGSIMHYRSNAFGRIENGVELQTIRSLRGLDGLTGQRNGLREMDARTIHWMYPHTGPTITSLTYPSGRPTLTWTTVPNALRYRIRLIQTFRSWGSNGGEGPTDYWSLVGETTATSIQDPDNSYTGRTYCSYQQGLNGWRLDYNYEVAAMYPFVAAARRIARQ